MTQPETSGIVPSFIVSHVPSSLSLYRDRLGFEVAFQGPNPDDIYALFFGARVFTRASTQEDL